MLPLHVPVAILAGGIGSRLRSVVSDRPKVLATVCGRPFLIWWLDAIARHGARDVILCTGYMAEKVEEEIGPSHGPLRLHYSAETTPLGTGGCLRQAWEKFSPETMLVLNGDSFCSPDLDAFFQVFEASGAAAGIVLREMEETSRYGRVDLAEDGRVSAFSEKGCQSGHGWINAGVYLLGRALLEPLPAGIPSSVERDHFPNWIGQGILGFPYGGPFLDIGTPESYAGAESFFSTLPP
jgi:D-glycero-alpha-D-manno-heptose 1-phosphate guanylyltransferase